MFAITAIIKTKKAHEDRMKKALLNVAQYVSLKEPENYEGIDPDNIDNKLFISNIISLYTFMDQMNNRAESKYKSPIIRPTLVFKQYQS